MTQQSDERVDIIEREIERVLRDCDPRDEERVQQQIVDTLASRFADTQFEADLIRAIYIVGHNLVMAPGASED